MFHKEITKTITMIFRAIRGVDTPKPLGRWYYIEKDTEKDKKVDWTNADHCGCCGRYTINKPKTIKTKINKTKINKTKSITPLDI